MHSTYNLTTAKAKLSAIISEVEFSKKKVFLTRKGENVAAIIPFDEYQKHTKKTGSPFGKRSIVRFRGL